MTAFETPTARSARSPASCAAMPRNHALASNEYNKNESRTLYVTARGYHEAVGKNIQIA